MAELASYLINPMALATTAIALTGIFPNNLGRPFK